MAHAQKPDFVFRQNGWAHWNRQGCQFSRLLAAEVCASAVVMLDTPCSEVVWRVLATDDLCWLPIPFTSFPIHFPSRASPCTITFQLDSTSACPHVVTSTSDRGSVSVTFEIIHRLEYKIPKVHSTIFLALNKPRFLSFCTDLSHFCERESQVLENLFFFRRWNWRSLRPKTCLNRFVSRNLQISRNELRVCFH